MRAFFACELGEPAARAVAEVGIRLAATLGPKGWKIGWVAPEKIHLTLRFLGNVAEERSAEIASAVRPACTVRAPIDVAVRHLGAFPERGAPRVLWIGIDDPSGDVASLALELEQRLSQIGFEREERRFHAHVTLGRVRQAGAGRFDEVGRALGEVDCGATRLAAVTLFKSELKTGTYHVLERIPFKGDPR